MGYVAWDGLTYEGTPPEGWYEASDGRWWPIGQGPAAPEVPPPPATAPPPPPPSKISDYLIEVAFLDDGGVRVGHSTAIISSVRPGESAPGDVTSFSDAAPIISCEVAAVTRNEAT